MYLKALLICAVSAVLFHATVAYESPGYFYYYHRQQLPSKHYYAVGRSQQQNDDQQYQVYENTQVQPIHSNIPRDQQQQSHHHENHHEHHDQIQGQITQLTPNVQAKTNQYVIKNAKVLEPEKAKQVLAGNANIHLVLPGYIIKNVKVVQMKKQN